MSRRWIATLAFAALLAGCRTAQGGWVSVPAPATDPDRWERLACRKGEYPVELDARALARARYEDLRARQSGATAPFAAARLESERSAFEARCAVWRAEADAASTTLASRAL